MLGNKVLIGKYFLISFSKSSCICSKICSLFIFSFFSCLSFQKKNVIIFPFHASIKSRIYHSIIAEKIICSCQPRSTVYYFMKKRIGYEKFVKSKINKRFFLWNKNINFCFKFLKKFLFHITTKNVHSAINYCYWYLNLVKNSRYFFISSENMFKSKTIGNAINAFQMFIYKISRHWHVPRDNLFSNCSKLV